ncbi:MAG: transcription antitermination factor NusB [Candidatus Marinimicrobia bacterium]|nr:transcription antitermination factor NusB [Candidatus Neomarinimicrobiota bacterium]|tara:strand:- start:2363 stop:2785 length:423 start_codon:yes stop_codon:yes gene_type:complete
MDKKEKRFARECALQMSYGYQMSNNNDIFKKIKLGYDKFENSSEIKDYAIRLSKKCLENNDNLDKLIISKSSNWDISRIAVIDRLIIRLALTEMIYFEEIPPKVSIVEAVEISKEYSTDDSAGFINGILDSIYKKSALTL